MDIGMLWLIQDKQPLSHHVKEAAQYYQNKYGAAPNLCYVNPGQFPQDHSQEEHLILSGMEIRPSGDTLPDHLWIGVENQAQQTGKEAIQILLPL